jgi:two-component system, OmpR family, response regulator PrrA
VRTQAPATALLVEDEAAVESLISRNLTRAGFVVYAARGKRDALRRAEEIGPDIVIVDLSLQGGGGEDICRRIRQLPRAGDVPLLVLSAQDDVEAKVALFEIGVDDVVVKPCEPAELLARVRALLRRVSERRTLRRIGPLRVALATGDAWVAGRQLDLTNGERSVLVELVRAHPGLAARRTLDRRPGREDEISSNVTEVLVTRLRRKIAAAGGGVEIRAVRRSGYLLRSIKPTEASA